MSPIYTRRGTACECGTTHSYTRAQPLVSHWTLSYILGEHGTFIQTKLRHVRIKHYDIVMVLHKKVYQESQVNYELTVLFAKGFSFHSCMSAKQDTNSEEHMVMWARIPEASIE